MKARHFFLMVSIAGFFLACSPVVNDQGYPKDALVLMDSVPLNNGKNAYIYVFNSGTPGGYSSSFLSVANSSKEISYETACLRTNSYYGMKLLSNDTLLLKLDAIDTIRLSSACDSKMKIELTSTGEIIDQGKHLEIYPYKK